MARRNKRRIDARIKPYLFERLNAIAEKLETTYTEVLETCLEKGMNWQITKIRREIDQEFLTENLSPRTKDNNKPTPEEEEEFKRKVEIAQIRWIDED